MEVYDIKIDIFQERARPPPFVKRFIEWYGGREFFYYEMAFFYRAERDRRVKRGEDIWRAVKMAQDMVNDLVLFLAKEYHIWDTSIQVVESYPDVSVITPEFEEFYGGQEKLRDDMMPFFKLECERRIDSFKEKPTVARFMAGYVVNWMTIRLARENGFLDIKKKELPHFKFPSLKRDPDYEDLIIKESPVAATEVEQAHTQDKKTATLERWPGTFGTVFSSDKGSQSSIKDLLPFIGHTYKDVDIKTRLLTKGAEIAALFTRDCDQASLCLRPPNGAQDFKKPIHNQAGTLDVALTIVKAITGLTPGLPDLAITEPWQRFVILPFNPTWSYIGQRMAGNLTNKMFPDVMSQIMTRIPSLDNRYVGRALLLTTSFHGKNSSIGLTPPVTMAFQISRLLPLITSIFLPTTTNEIRHDVNFARNLPIDQRDNAVALPNELISNNDIAKPVTDSVQIDEPHVSLEKAGAPGTSKVTPDKTPRFDSIRKMFGRLRCFFGNETNDE